jgi:hypothetical protein
VDKRDVVRSSAREMNDPLSYGVLNKPAKRRVCIVGETGIEVFMREVWKQW